MRDCPHCGEQIQDEAVYCRHCHQDVEPPLWVDSMRRCQHCAEWIDLENENCQYCGKHVGVVDLEAGSEFVESLLRGDDSEQPSQWAAEGADVGEPEPEAGQPRSGGTAPFIEDEPSDGGSSSPFFGQAPADFDFEQHFADLDRANADQDPSALEGQTPESQSEHDLEHEQQAGFERDRPLADDEPSGSGWDRAGERPDFNQDLRRSLIEPEPEPEPELDPEEEYESEYESEQESEYGSEHESEYESQYQLPSQQPPPRFQPEASSPAPGETVSDYAFASQQPESDYVSPPASEPDYEAQSSIWASEVQDASSLRSDQPAPVVDRERLRLPTGVLQGLAALALIGGLGYGVVALASGPAGDMLAARLAETLATDVPTETPIPQPTATLRSAPTLPPETQTALDPTAIASSGTGDCRSWDEITLEDEGSELCAYGVIRRWFAVEDVPFVAIFSEELGTFAIVDRTTTHPVGPGDCIVARGTVEVMSRTRPDIDLNGTLEFCPEEWLAEG